jgi:hypothetical protein
MNLLAVPVVDLDGGVFEGKTDPLLPLVEGLHRILCLDDHGDPDLARTQSTTGTA